MPEDRRDLYLDGLTQLNPGLPYTPIAALDSYAPSYDEWAAMQEDEDRAREYILDAGLDYGDLGSAAYALAW